MEQVSNPSEETQPQIAVVDTASGTVIPDEIKSMLDTTFESPVEPAIAVPHVQEAEGLTVLHQEATHHHGHHDDAPENKPSPLLSGNVPHAHQGDATGPQHETGVHDLLGNISYGHVHGHHQENSVNASNLEHAHSDESGHGHYDILTGAEKTNAVGKTITEVLDLHGHTEFHVAHSEGVVTIGLGKGTRRFSGHDGVHASVGASLAEPVYGVVTPGAKIEIGDEGQRFTLSVKSPEEKQVQWWAGVTAGGDEHGHADHIEHHGDEIHGSSMNTKNATPTRLNTTKEADGDHEEEHHKEATGIGIESVMKHLESGLRGKLPGNISATGGIEHGAAYYRFELPLKIQERDVKLSLLTRAELGHDGEKNVGVFFRIKGQL